MNQIYKKILAFVLPILPTIVMGASASADYKWVDEEGVIHLTDDLQNMPERYRPQAEKVEPPPLQKAPRTPLPLSLNEEVDAQGHGKDWWQSRVREWEEERDRAIAQIGKLNLERADLQFKNLMPSERIQERNRISQEITLEEGKKREAERMLNEDLPEEARKAGAPSGWLREPRK